MWKSIKNIILLFIGIIVLSFVVLTITNTYERFLIYKISKAIVKVTMTKNQYIGGTGFQVMAPWGEKIIVTNDHICEGMLNNTAYISHDKKTWKSKIIAQSNYTDLCILTGIEQLPVLTLGWAQSRFDTILILGHPALQPITPSKGRVIATIKVRLFIFKSEKDCKGSGYSWEETKRKFGSPIYACIRRVESIMTTAKIFPGSSGSPVINRFGLVTGVIFAGNFLRQSSYYIPVQELQDFLYDIMQQRKNDSSKTNQKENTQWQ